MLRKTLMLNASNTDYYPYYTVKMEKVPTDNPLATVNIESIIKPQGKFQRIACTHTKNSFIEFDITSIDIKNNIEADAIRVTQLDTGRSLDMYKGGTESDGYNFSSFVGMLFNLSDVGKEIQITLDFWGGGLSSFFRRFVTFLRGGLRNAKSLTLFRFEFFTKEFGNFNNNSWNFRRGFYSFWLFRKLLRKSFPKHLFRLQDKYVNNWSTWGLARGAARILWEFPISKYDCSENGQQENSYVRVARFASPRLYNSFHRPNIIRSGRYREKASYYVVSSIASSALCAGGSHA